MASLMFNIEAPLSIFLEGKLMIKKEQLYEGPLVSLKRFKDDVREAREGYECGMVFDRFSDLQEGDQIEAYKMVEVERTS